MPPTITVVIPAYNAERFLADAIQSILAQDYAHLDIVVVDDGSTDETAAVAQNFGPSVRVIRQANAGIGRARNAGVEIATSDLLAFLDADDVWVEDSLATRLAHLEAQPDLDGVFGLVETWYDGVEQASFAVKAGEVASGTIAGTLLIKRECFHKAGAFTDARLGEFIEWYARAIDTGLRFETVDQVVLRRRVHGANTTATTADRGAYLRAMQSIIARRRAEGR